MAKLTKRQNNALNSIYFSLNTAIAYLEQENVAICHKEQDTTPRGQLDYSRRCDNTVLTEHEKFIGSQLSAILNAKEALGHFIFDNNTDRKSGLK